MKWITHTYTHTQSTQLQIAYCSKIKSTSKSNYLLFATAVDKLFILFPRSPRWKILFFSVPIKNFVCRQFFLSLFEFFFLFLFLSHTLTHNSFSFFSHVSVIWCPGEKIERQFNVCIQTMRSVLNFVGFCFRLKWASHHITYKRAHIQMHVIITKYTKLNEKA